MTDPNPPSTQPEPEGKHKRHWQMPLITGIVGIVIGAAGSGIAFSAAASSQEASEKAAAAAEAQSAEDAKSTLFLESVQSCSVSGSQVEIGDDGYSMSVDMKGKKDYGAGLDASEVWCIVDKLGTPESIKAVMEQTRALDGRQTDSFDDIEVSWSYHPDRGMDSVWSISK
jgi:hypothetical protein